MRKKAARARRLRERQTEAESLLWAALRANQLCNLKFRRQHPVGPFFADFACASEKLIVELDGQYHDVQFEKDKARQQYLESEGWTVVRFSNEDVLEDVNAVTISIAQILGRAPEYQTRTGARTGMFAPKPSSPPNKP